MSDTTVRFTGSDEFVYGHDLDKKRVYEYLENAEAVRTRAEALKSAV